MSTQRQNTRRFRRLKQEFFDRCRRERPVCWQCGQPIDYDAEPGTTPDSLTLDHRYPVSRRPDLQEDPGNFEPAHLSCNARRGDRDPHDSLGTLSRDWAGALRGGGAVRDPKTPATGLPPASPSASLPGVSPDGAHCGPGRHLGSRWPDSPGNRGDLR